MNCTHDEIDQAIFADEFADFLPNRMFDAHVHFFDDSCLHAKTIFPAEHPYTKFGGVFGPKQYRQWASRALPDIAISATHFGHPGFESNRDATAIYADRISDNRQVFGLALIAPNDSASVVRQRVMHNHLVGFKPYPNFVTGKPVADVTIHDMLPAAQMEVADELGLAIMLHIPRPGRLADPVNQKQMIELCQRYPNAKIIFAHVGRAYFLRNAIGFLDGIAACHNAWIDTSMVNHEGVLEYAFRTFPKERILFGSDAPFALIRGKSVEINNQYAYIVGEDYAMGATIYDPDAKQTFTTFYYEQLRGIKLAAERAGMTRQEIEDYFYNNANRLFRSVAANLYGAAAC